MTHGYRWLDASNQPFSFLGQGAKVTFDLEAVPELVGLTEERTKAYGHRRRNGAFAVNNFVDGSWGNPDCASHGILRNAHWLEIFLKKNLAGCDRVLHFYTV